VGAQTWPLLTREMSVKDEACSIPWLPKSLRGRVQAASLVKYTSNGDVSSPQDWKLSLSAAPSAKRQDAGPCPVESRVKQPKLWRFLLFPLYTHSSPAREFVDTHRSPTDSSEDGTLTCGDGVKDVRR